MASLKLNLETEFLTTTCCNCGCVVALTREIMQARRRDHATFYCPNGHPLSFTGEPTEEQLRKRLNDSLTRESTAKIEAEYQRKRANEEALKREAAENKLRRVKNGVCPCCKRSFSNLGRHMKGKHPDFAEPNMGKSE